jgi:DNA-binding beta-propeller fold protein YncE
MKFRMLTIALFFVSWIMPLSARAQIASPLSNVALPTYVRKFQSDADVNRPTRLNQFAFRVSGYPTTEDRVVDHRGQWDADPMKHRDEIVVDCPHVVRSASSFSLGPAVASFGDAFADAVSHVSSHPIFMAQPRAITTDAGKRVIVSDPTAQAIHIFDLEANRYLRIQGGEGCRLQAPAGVAVDGRHNIYVTDTDLGVIVVYDRYGHFLRYIGARNNQEGGIFYQASGIAIDDAKGRIYVPDTVRHMIVVLDLNGNVIRYLGRPDLDSIRLRQRDGGAQERGKLQSPTQVVIQNEELYVLGISRVQIFDLDGRFKAEFPLPETSFSETSGLAVDAQGRFFVSDYFRGTIFAYDRTGNLLYSFGHPGLKHQEFNHPQGLWIDEENHIYVADSTNGRVQVFQLHEPPNEVMDAETHPSKPSPIRTGY